MTTDWKQKFNELSNLIKKQNKIIEEQRKLLDEYRSTLEGLI